MKTVLKIGIDALPNAELARFTALFPVAETRTRVSWVRVRAADADVVVSHGRPWRGTRAVSLCIAPAAPRGLDVDGVPLESGFGVLALIGSLDRAAALVLGSRGARSADTLSTHHARMVATMSRRAVARDWTATGGSLSFTEIDELLSELRELDALPRSGAEPLVWQPAKPSPVARQSRPGVVSRLRGWFARERAARAPAQGDPS